MPWLTGYPHADARTLSGEISLWGFGEDACGG